MPYFKVLTMLTCLQCWHCWHRFQLCLLVQIKFDDFPPILLCHCSMLVLCISLSLCQVSLFGQNHIHQRTLVPHNPGLESDSRVRGAHYLYEEVESTRGCFQSTPTPLPQVPDWNDNISIRNNNLVNISIKKQGLEWPFTKMWPTQNTNKYINVEVRHFRVILGLFLNP